MERGRQQTNAPKAHDCWRFRFQGVKYERPNVVKTLSRRKSEVTMPPPPIE
jgi:hypothetical protein